MDVSVTSVNRGLDGEGGQAISTRQEHEQTAVSTEQTQTNPSFGAPPFATESRPPRGLPSVSWTTLSSAAAAATPLQATAMSRASDTQASGAGPVNSGSGQPMSFRRQRASRACETCHARKVRCDAASLGVPCTNCTAFNIECRIPTSKRKRPATLTKEPETRETSLSPGTGGASASSRGFSSQQYRPITASRVGEDAGYGTSQFRVAGSEPSTKSDEALSPMQTSSVSPFDNMVKPRLSRAPLMEAGRVVYLGESSNLNLLVRDRQGSSEVVHYPLPVNVKGSRAQINNLDPVEIDILKLRGAFLLPPRELCDDLIESYFKWVHPIVPVINKAKFMRQYHDPNNQPSLLLLQALLLAGSRVCSSPWLMDANGSSTPAALTFYKRAKALFDASYEDDRVTIVQSLILMGWYWEGPEDVTKNVFYWTRVAIIVAQGSGVHRSVEHSQLSSSDKRLWKRIWWTLFTRDRSVAASLGRPMQINLEDSDVEMLTPEDFIEDEPDCQSEHAPDPVHVHFFLQYVKLCEITGIVLSQQYSVASRGRRQNAIDLRHSDMALADWLQNCPRHVVWESSRHHFLAALLHANYYTTLCLLHRAHMPPASAGNTPSRNIAFQAAAMITSILDKLSAQNELRYCPAFIVYSIFSALIMHVYQLRSPVPLIGEVTQDRIQRCMSALKEVGRTWLVGKLVAALFDAIIGNKMHEERLQKAPGKRHKNLRKFHEDVSHRSQPGGQPTASLTGSNVGSQQPVSSNGPVVTSLLGSSAVAGSRSESTSKRKFDDMALDSITLGSSTPQQQESYERSRPQTPSFKSEAAITPMTCSQGAMLLPGVTLGTNLGRPTSDVSMACSAPGLTRGLTSNSQPRAETPLNSSFPLHTSPPDLYLVTRNTPKLSQALFENFQPDQLFPESAQVPLFPHVNPVGDPVYMAHSLAPLTTSDTGGDGGGSSTAYTTQLGVPLQQHQLVDHTQQAHLLPSDSGMKLMTADPLQIDLMGGTDASADAGYSTGGMWATNFEGLPDIHSPGDSRSQASNQPVPSTLNVEDWFQFFGINGDFSSMLMDMPSNQDPDIF